MVTILFIFLSPLAFAGDRIIATKGGDPLTLNPEMEIGDLAFETTVEKETIKAIEVSSLPISVDDRFSDTPFLYFFNGVIPKDPSDKRVWNMGGHYLNIIKINDQIFVNNLFTCSSLKMAQSKDHLVCKQNGYNRLINFDGTTRDNRNTGSLCPYQGSKTVLYGNCIIALKKNSVRCELTATWASSRTSQIKKYCRSVDISGELLYCNRKKLKNREVIDLTQYCLTDSSIINSIQVYDTERFGGHEGLDPNFFVKEPPNESQTISK